MQYQPHPYQLRAIEHLLNNPAAALFLDMGLGKTSIVATALLRMWQSLSSWKVLIVAPKRVARHTWPDEFAKWDHLNELSYSLVLGSAATRIDATRSDTFIHIINYENLAWLIAYWGRAWPYDHVVFDESSKMKSHSTKRFTSFRKVRDRVRACWLLTGTPTSNGLLGMWSQAYCMDGGERLGTTITGYRDAYFYPGYMGYTFKLKLGADVEIQQKLSDVAITMTAEDYLALPDRTNVVTPVYLPDKAMRTYDRLKRDLIVELEEVPVVAANAAVLTNKLLQVANGAPYTDENSSQWEELHTAKLDALADTIDEAQGASVLVAYAYKSDLARLRERFDVVTIDEPGAIDMWNQGKVRLLAAHPASAGHGLNLQAGGNIVVWFSMIWSLELYMQFNARLHRQGQTKPVFVHHLIAAGTLDEHVLQVLQEKRSVQDAFVDAFKPEPSHSGAGTS